MVIINIMMKNPFCFHFNYEKVLLCQKVYEIKFVHDCLSQGVEGSNPTRAISASGVYRTDCFTNNVTSNSTKFSKML